MPPIDDVDLGQVFRALADPLRRAVVAELAADPSDAGRASSSFPMPVTESTETRHSGGPPAREDLPGRPHREGWRWYNERP